MNRETSIPTCVLRRGITVMEVLISLAIVAIGLLGVIAMLPVGHLFVQNAIRADLSIALAEKGFNDIMLRSRNGQWLSSLALNEPVAVDPLSTDAANLGGSGLKRNAAGISQAMAKEIFVGTDDVAYEPPATAGGLPKVTYIKDSGGADWKRGYYGDYTILATVVPQGAGSRVAKVSVATFCKRNADAAVEKRLPAVSLGGSDIELTGAVNIKKNQWILLEATTTGFYGWYRVIVAADVGTKTWVTLDGTGIPATVNGAIVFDQVLAVYERTVTIP
jgi:hypothetical protein